MLSLPVLCRNAGICAARERSTLKLNVFRWAVQTSVRTQISYWGIHGPDDPEKLPTTRSAVVGRTIRSPVPDLVLPLHVPLHQLVLEKCDEFRDRIAFEEYESGRTMTYAELKSGVTRVTSALRGLGLVKGDVILVCSTNNMDYTVLNIACSALGVWFATVNSMSLSRDLCSYIDQTKPRVIFCSPSTAQVTLDALENVDIGHIPEIYVFGDHPGLKSFNSLTEVEGDDFLESNFDPLSDILLLPFSSGTSGFPKGVMTKNSALVANIMQFLTCIPISPDDRMIGNLPLYHIYGLLLQFCPLVAGATTVVVEKRFTPESYLSCLQDKQITLSPLVPPLTLFLAKSPLVDNYDLSSVRRVMCGAAPLGKDLIRQFQRRHPHMTFLHLYGMTEVILASSTIEGDPLDSVGHMAPNTFGKIVDLDTKEALGPNQVGELLMKGPQQTAGYFNSPQGTADLFTQDGWLHSGDIGYYSEDGCLYITDRLKEFIKYKGHQVAPAELEDVLLGHPDVQDAAVTRVPDADSGEVPRAFVVRKEGSQLTEEDLVNYVKEITSPEKWLRGGVQFIDEVPKNPSGKILRRVLRERYID